MVIPFLGILFETQKKVYNPPPLSVNATAIKDNFYALISSIIDEKGKVEALLFICILVLITFFFRNLLMPISIFYIAKYLSADYDSFFWLWALFQWSLSLLLLGAVIYFMKYRLEKSRRVI